MLSAKRDFAVLFLSVIFAFSIFANFAFASIVINPAKQGFYKIELYPFIPATLSKSFEINNTFNYSIDIIVVPSVNSTNAYAIENGNFTLQPQESRIVNYSVTIKDPGFYREALNIYASAQNKTLFGFQSDLIISATKNTAIPDIFLAVIILAIILPLAFLVWKKRKAMVKKK